MPINLEDTQKINNFTEYKSTLEDIKNILDNKKKINKSTNDIEMTKEVKSDTAMIVDCTERENSTKKKKKESRKRLKEKIDTSEIVKKIKEDSKLYEGELKDQNENPEVKGPDETIHPLSPKANPVDFKNESGKKIIIGTSEKKAKAERVIFLFIKRIINQLQIISRRKQLSLPN